MNLTLNLRTPDADRIANVSVMGSWDEWGTRMQMEQVGKGQWTATCVVPEGKVRFKFLVDDQWTTGDGYDVEDDGFGGVNNYVFVRELGAAGGADDDGDAVHVDMDNAEIEGNGPLVEEVAHDNAGSVQEEDDMAADLDGKSAQHGQGGDKKSDSEGQPENKDEGCVIC